MKKIVILIIVIIGTSIFLNAQINETYMLNSNDLTIQQTGEYQVISTIENFNTDEIGHPKLPVKIVSFVLPYESTVTGLTVNSTQQQLNGSYDIFRFNTRNRSMAAILFLL